MIRQTRFSDKSKNNIPCSKSMLLCRNTLQKNCKKFFMVINQDTEVFHHEGQPVTLECSYDSSSRNVYLYWYRQYPNKAPQYLLYKGARSRSDEHTSDRRFSSATFERSTQLTISGLTLAETALYYCALCTQ
uniref:Ig-like domain-containing protein n=1 Tax=Electrophorus electricus TaxID=8005 RepID=A0A4W4FTV6_ELEEL